MQVLEATQKQIQGKDKEIARKYRLIYEKDKKTLTETLQK